MKALGPPVHEFMAAEGIEISDFIADRRACTHADFQSEALDVYRHLHSAPKLALAKTVFDMFDEHRDQVRSLNGWLPPISNGCMRINMTLAPR